jgi:hypothetical protein
MMLGMSLHAFTLMHVVISLIGIGSGLVVLFGFLAAKEFKQWILLFLVSTAATSLTGFLFPFHRLLPSYIVGILSLIVLAGAIVARYSFHSAGTWRSVFVVCATIALYLNVFVLIVQLFKHVPVFHVLAPTQTEPPFLIAQVTVLAVFVVLGIFAAKRFRIPALRGR